MKKYAMPILFVILLIGCSRQPKNNVLTTTQIPLLLATINPTSAMVTSTTTPSASPTPRPTITMKPTRTLSPEIATRESALDSCRGNAERRLDKYIFQAYSSSNQWSAIVCQDNGIYTKVSNPTLGINWSVAPVDDEDPSGPQWFWEPFLWSGDGRYLYLKSEAVGFIDSPWLRHSSGFGLARLDLETGNVENWLKPSQYGYSFAFNQSGTVFAFSPHDYFGVIKVRDLISGEEQTLSFKEKYYILSFEITPDSSRLVILAQETSGDQPNDSVVVFTYNINTRALKKIVEADSPALVVPATQIETNILLSQLSNDFLLLIDIYSDNDLQIDIRTGEIIVLNGKPTPTATP